MQSVDRQGEVDRNDDYGAKAINIFVNMTWHGDAGGRGADNQGLDVRARADEARSPGIHGVCYTWHDRIRVRRADWLFETTDNHETQQREAQDGGSG